MSDEQAEAPDPAGRGAAAAGDQRKRRVCQFPTGYDPETGEFAVHGVPLDDVPRGRGKGRPGEYCGALVVDEKGIPREHTRVKAYERRRELERGGDAMPAPEQPAARPVTSARATLLELLEQWQVQTTAHHAQLTALVDRIGKVVSLAGDPDAAEVEVTATRRAADEAVRVATARAEEAETDAATARRELARAIEDREIAEGAADDALRERDEQVAAAKADADRARAEAADAKAELEQLRTDTAEKIRITKQEALDLVQAAEDEAAKKNARVEQAAERRIIAAHAERDTAAAAQQRAEQERAAAVQARDDARAEVAQQREEVSAARAQARDDVAHARGETAAARAELAAAREAAHTEREQQRADHAAELARIQSAADARAATLEQALTAANDLNRRLEAQLNGKKGTSQ